MGHGCEPSPSFTTILLLAAGTDSQNFEFSNRMSRKNDRFDLSLIFKIYVEALRNQYYESVGRLFGKRERIQKQRSFILSLQRP